MPPRCSLHWVLKFQRLHLCSRAAQEHEGLKVKSDPVPASLTQAAEELAAKIEKEAESKPRLLEAFDSGCMMHAIRFC